LLCGVLISEENYRSLEQKIIALKQEIFDTDKVILHSREIRKCEGYFKKLFDLQVKQQFYEVLDQIIIDTPFTLISNAVKKIEYIKQY
jgi:hypothetical protein